MEREKDGNWKQRNKTSVVCFECFAVNLNEQHADTNKLHVFQLSLERESKNCWETFVWGFYKNVNRRIGRKKVINERFEN
jgi:hypothetical protein